MNRQQAINFLNKELRDRAQARGLEVIPEQAQFNMAEVAKVKIKNAQVKSQ